MEHKILPNAAGIGLRQIHHREFLETLPQIAWIEVHSENFMGGGPDLTMLAKIRQDYPVSLHGVGLSLGSADGIDQAHLERLAILVEMIEPQAISDHLSWSVNGGHYYNDLLPLPYTKEALQVMIDNVAKFQDRLKRQVMVENPSTYLQFSENDMSEPEFIQALCKTSGCGLLLDVNNVVVNAFNHEFQTRDYIDQILSLPIGEIHLAGHHTKPLGNRAIKIDDHGSLVSPEVWELFDYTLKKIGRKPALIEWDSDIPDLAILLNEAKKAEAYLDAA